MLGAGLVARYLLRARRLSAVPLLAVPALDVVLVAASLADVAGESPPGLTHGLTAIYLGFTVAFGHSMIQWADTHFAHRFAGEPRPPRPPRYGAAKVAYEWRGWSKAALGWVITLGVMLTITAVAGTGVPAPLDWFADPMWNRGARAGVAVLI
jgi:hypothetical protein